MELRLPVAPGVHLWTEQRGSADAPPLLLIMGAGASGLGWPEPLVDALAVHHRVIRYDHRDTGRSTWAYGQQPYRITDLAEDAVGSSTAWAWSRPTSWGCRSAACRPSPRRCSSMANPGYGQRSAPDQLPHTAHDFAHLPPREAAIAAYIDRLPGGADVSVKTLAKQLPYGQCAMRTALNNLQRAGHLRRGREHLAESGSPRWITRTWFTRTAREDDWWAAFTRGGVPQESPEKARPTRSRAHILLAALGRATPSLSLSARDCEALTPLLTEWFARGATDEHVIQSLTAGLPVPVHSPAALIRTRLTTKLPPEPEPEVTPPPRPPLRVLECAKCGTPGRPEALPGGICGPCQGAAVPPGPSVPLTSTAVHAHAAAARAAMVDRRERPRP